MTSEPVVHVIDDDEAARHSLEFLLDCAGLKVRTYTSAVAFLKHVDRLEPGCIVTDVRMPEMTGIELIDRLKEIGVRQPVIIITGHADVPMVIKAMKQGVADFIEKRWAVRFAAAVPGLSVLLRGDDFDPATIDYIFFW